MPHNAIQNTTHKNINTISARLRETDSSLHPEPSSSRLAAHHISNSHQQPHSQYVPTKADQLSNSNYQKPPLECVIKRTLCGLIGKFKISQQIMKNEILALPMIISEEHKKFINQKAANYASACGLNESYEIDYESSDSESIAQTTRYTPDQTATFDTAKRKAFSPDLIEIQSITGEFTPVKLTSGQSLKERWAMAKGLVSFLKKSTDEGHLYREPFETFKFFNENHLEQNHKSGEIRFSLKGYILNCMLDKYNPFGRSTEITHDIKYGADFIKNEYLTYRFAPEIFSSYPKLDKAIIYSLSITLAEILTIDINDIKDEFSVKISNLLADMQHTFRKARPDFELVYREFLALSEQMEHEIKQESQGYESPFLNYFKKNIAKQ
ncbi:hypothetical protein GA565_06515 [Rouxiella sp. S1S-2]|uniref:hypothetical protein n=1 Tax=Rouxiella sp. S1S-2 TaxID=2653856 RepID=UPI0012644DC3|nr:hypothetical protein [Rouxiella sp. S1S-2]KAB7895666.1 hypothetical protein GA565_06515 [Rouxiella sp. S1S-2]